MCLPLVACIIEHTLELSSRQWLCSLVCLLFLIALIRIRILNSFECMHSYFYFFKKQFTYKSRSQLSRSPLSRSCLLSSTIALSCTSLFVANQYFTSITLLSSFQSYTCYWLLRIKIFFISASYPVCLYECSLMVDLYVYVNICLCKILVAMEMTVLIQAVPYATLRQQVVQSLVLKLCKLLALCVVCL